MNQSVLKLEDLKGLCIRSVLIAIILLFGARSWASKFSFDGCYQTYSHGIVYSTICVTGTDTQYSHNTQQRLSFLNSWDNTVMHCTSLERINVTNDGSLELLTGQNIYIRISKPKNGEYPVFVHDTQLKSIKVNSTIAETLFRREAESQKCPE